MSIAMTLTSKAQFTLNKGLLDHLGVKAGDKISIRKMPNGKIEIEAQSKKMSKNHFLKFLDGHFKTDKKLTIDEMNEEIAKSYAEAGMKGIE
jgi:bifunctional DNA-binding transcriptional regulator/antitoxin component of YhaV-PrlF toxin-antitoxin module